MINGKFKNALQNKYYSPGKKVRQTSKTGFKDKSKSADQESGIKIISLNMSQIKPKGQATTNKYKMLFTDNHDEEKTEFKVTKSSNLLVPDNL